MKRWGWTFVITYRKLLSAVALGIISLVAALTRFEWLANKVNDYLSQHIVLSAPGIPTLDNTYVMGITGALVGLVILLVASLILAWFYFQRAHNPDIKNRYEKAQKNLDHQIENSLKIANKLYPAGGDPPRLLDEGYYTISVDKDGTGWVKRFYKVRAHDKPLHYWPIGIWAEPEADSVEYLDEMEFRVDERDERYDIGHLLTEDKPHFKQVTLFHLPHIEPTEQDPRIVEVTYRWPRMLRRVLDKGFEDWTWTVRSARNVPLVEFTLFYHPDIGKITFNLIGRSPTQPPPSPVPITSESGWPGWRYNINDALATPFDYKFRIQRVDGR